MPRHVAPFQPPQGSTRWMVVATLTLSCWAFSFARAGAQATEGGIATEIEGAASLIEARTWTDNTGKQKTTAEFVKMEGDQVTLRKPGTNKTVTVPFDRLSDEDQVYVEDLLDQLSDLESEAERRRKKNAAPPVAEKDEETSRETRRSVEANRAKNRARTVPNNVANSVRGAVYRQQTMNNLRQIGLAIMSHASQKGSYPTASINARDGRPLLSWRVAVLPLLDENALYRQFRLNEPWDSEHNRKLIDRMPKVFASPGSDLGPGFSNYLAVAGTDTVLAMAKRGTRMADVRDGTSKTLMLVEVDDTHAVEWTRPAEYEWDVDDPLYGLGGIWPGQFFGVFADGRVSRLDTTMGTTSLNGLATRAGGEFVRVE